MDSIFVVEASIGRVKGLDLLKRCRPEMRQMVKERAGLSFMTFISVNRVSKAFLENIQSFPVEICNIQPSRQHCQVLFRVDMYSP